MSHPERYEMLVLGNGPDGKLLAWQGQVGASHRSRRAQTDRRLLPDINCLPSENEIWSAKVADLVHHADRFGIVTGPVATDMKRVLAGKRHAPASKFISSTWATSRWKRTSPRLRSSFATSLRSHDRSGNH